MKTERISWKFHQGYGIKHRSETDIWTIHSMPDFEYITTATSLQKARRIIETQLAN